MSVWNKVLLVLVILCTVAFVYFGADALKMRRESQKKLVDAQKTLEAEREKHKKLSFGTGQDDGFFSLVNQVDRLRKFRDTRAWPNCMPLAKAVVNGTTVSVQLQVDVLPSPTVSQSEDDTQPNDNQQPDTSQSDDLAAPVSLIAPPVAGAIDPNAIDPDAVSEPVTLPQDRILPGTVVYLFDKRAIADGGCLLGEFTVAKVDNNIATLTNVYQMTEAEVKRINDSVNAPRVSWAVYTVLPRTAAEIKEADFEAGEPLADAIAVGGSESGDDDSDEKFVANIASQQSSDLADSPEVLLSDPTNDPRPALAQTFASLNNKRRQMLNHVDMQKNQQKNLATAQVEAMEMIGFYQKEKDNTQAQQQETLRQNGEVKKLYDATVAEITNIQELIANLKSQNKKMLAELTQAQLRASEIIHERDASFSMTK